MRRLGIGLAVALALAGCRPGSGSGGGGPLPPRDWDRYPALFTLSGSEEICAVGDLHGDLDVTLRLLLAGGFIAREPPHRWTGGRRILVITGDVIDKGVAATAILDLLIALETQARAAGGALVVTLGNHEAEFLAEPSGPKSMEFQGELVRLGLDPAAVAAGQSPYGEWLLRRPVAALIDGWFFAHAGHSDGKSAASIAKKYRALLEEPNPPQPRFGDSFFAKSSSLLEAQSWWREGGGAEAMIDANLGALPARHIVFGHDPGELEFPGEKSRSRGQMGARYGGRLFFIDVGMSYAVGYSKGALLRLTRAPTESATMVRVDGTTAHLWP